MYEGMTTCEMLAKILGNMQLYFISLLVFNFITTATLAALLYKIMDKLDDCS